MTESEDIEIVKKRLGRRSIVLVGLMGCGKSSVGKRLAFKLGLPFVDADDEIERAAAKSINEIFADHGEALFRDGERKVIARLLRNGPQVLATGGGAYMHAETRQSVRENGISIWLRAELPVLMRRVMKRDTRPLLREGNPEATMQKLIEARYPVYAEADMTVESRDEPHDIIVAEILNRLAAPSTAQARTSQGAAPSRSVSVELGDRSYDVLIASGLLRDAGALIKARLGAVKCGVVTDENVARHHLATLEESLKAEGLFAGSIVMKPGQFVIFWSTLMHSSFPNSTVDQTRLGYASRYVPAAVKVYPDTDTVDEYGSKISLDKFGVVLVSGEDRFGHNRRVERNARGVSFAQQPSYA